ncbi:MAG TPA: molybdenum cofactor biosynthesis protein MoaE [Spirochaetota bacterium]|nr:molybdenum cofactor biosynthesis protein MoaE [Spirochaetota bacterium]HPF06245.1 molybdenum cofactor biosynthesis protein MoaE [Spirochaetota bacterium]HPJ41428.1 molybdenum cofactor biosynthesis protein MoaE [Spirochaetota bacterium]HPR36471.1 molybdenum cofactor biosynthesis protein MoaE [Spirochaetota bacterium]HRX47854.1 molybdenum cofactor biosynthesis protein MoaE [Spirochaetota bacterium]
MKHIVTQEEPINLNTLLAHGDAPSNGADLVFIGKVRDHSRGKTVLHIDYEIYDTMALKELNKIADEALAQWDTGRILIVHRYGRVNIGEASIVIAVSSSHRDESYRSSRYIIDEIKKRVPIWKKEFYSDGSEWIGDRN